MAVRCSDILGYSGRRDKESRIVDQREHSESRESCGIACLTASLLSLRVEGANSAPNPVQSACIDYVGQGINILVQLSWILQSGKNLLMAVKVLPPNYRQHPSLALLDNGQILE